jgi:hypothetical protein
LSPTAIRDYAAYTNSIDNPVVPKFMFLLNTKSSSLNPRKEAFKFSDGIIISQPQCILSQTHTDADEKVAELLASNLLVAATCYPLYEASLQQEMFRISVISQRISG